MAVTIVFGEIGIPNGERAIVKAKNLLLDCFCLLYASSTAQSSMSDRTGHALCGRKFTNKIACGAISSRRTCPNHTRSGTTCGAEIWTQDLAQLWTCVNRSGTCHHGTEEHASQAPCFPFQLFVWASISETSTLNYFRRFHSLWGTQVTETLYKGRARFLWSWHLWCRERHGSFGVRCCCCKSKPAWQSGSELHRWREG